MPTRWIGRGSTSSVPMAASASRTTCCAPATRRRTSPAPRSPAESTSQAGKAKGPLARALRRRCVRSVGDERVNHVLEVFLEFLVGHLRLLRAQLQEADIGGVGQARAVDRLGATEPGLAERRGEVILATLRDALDDRTDRRMLQRAQQLAVDRMRLGLVADQLEQLAQSLARIGHVLEAAEHLFLFDLLPALQRGLQQRVTR